MSGPEYSDGDDIQIEVSDTRADGETAPSAPGRSPFAPRYTGRQRAARAAIGLLALVIVVSGITGVGGRMLGTLTARAPKPTMTDTPILPTVNSPSFPPAFPTAAPAVDLAANDFYLLPNPPGVSVSLDGRTLATLPAPGDLHPLQLVNGHHVFTWTSHVYPFVPLRCTLSVPHSDSDTCLTSPSGLPPDDTYLAGHVIAQHASLATLPDVAAGQLTQAVQSTLAALPSLAIVQPGESYLFYEQGQNGGPITSTQPLRATLSYQFFPNAGYFEPCNLTQPIIPCRFPGQDCSELCTVSQPPAAVLTSPNDWIAAAEVSALWSYTAPNDRVVAQNIGEEFGLQLAVLRITWDSSAWHVTPIVGSVPDLPVAADLVCDPARFWVGTSNTFSFMVEDPPPGASVAFIADANPTDGCLVVLDQHPPDTPATVFLERFGVLVDANSLDPTERQLAQRLASQVGVSSG